MNRLGVFWGDGGGYFHQGKNLLFVTLLAGFIRFGEERSMAPPCFPKRYRGFRVCIRCWSPNRRHLLYNSSRRVGHLVYNSSREGWDVLKISINNYGPGDHREHVAERWSLLDQPVLPFALNLLLGFLGLCEVILLLTRSMCVCECVYPRRPVSTDRRRCSWLVRIHGNLWGVWGELRRVVGGEREKVLDYVAVWYV